eukprot:TRINITY_DN3909_c0_g1_i2.p1 TRINITY_DN3909_c0_g1~~TRINITY_DN3909_c0_g1_i2.p1  ORF type:complete len:291 (+),score=36.31 TRINITY_DN3909_c0_g1_i2:266-1138(+)
MGDHLVLYVDKLITSETFQARREDEESGSASNLTKNEVLNHKEEDSVAVEVKENGNPEDETIPLVKSSGVKYGECRICQEEDEETKMESPCACSGSLKFAHRKCVQRWCNEKGSIICEICHQTYGPGYTAPPQSDESDDSAIDLSESWGVPGAQVNLHDPRLIAMAAAERHFFEPDYDEYAAANASGAAFCRSAALILLALLFLRHALTVTSAEEDADSSTFLSLFLLRAAGFLLPCYIMAWAISILQRRRQRQEESMTASEVAFLLHAGRARSLQYTVSPVASIRHELP